MRTETRYVETKAGPQGRPVRLRTTVKVKAAPLASKTYYIYTLRAGKIWICLAKAKSTRAARALAEARAFSHSTGKDCTISLVAPSYLPGSIQP